MAREEFVPKNFQKAARSLIAQANEILEEYDEQGLVLTLRQLYYQFVARDLFPADRRFLLVGKKWVRSDSASATPNAEPNYKWLGGVISDARLAGLVDWRLMEDRTRELEEQAKWDTPADIIEAVADQYREDLWRTQKWRPEVWIEKDALIGVIERPCNDLRVPYFACRGYNSQSAAYEAAQRFRRYARTGQKPIILHFGDHDPSGLDMTRDNRERFDTFNGFGAVKAKRLALNMDQVEQYNPPPNPTKSSDARAQEYIAQYGESSWELDALEPTVIGQLIRDEVNTLRDTRAWEIAGQEERDNKADLALVSNRWDDVRDFVRDE